MCEESAVRRLLRSHLRDCKRVRLGIVLVGLHNVDETAGT
jgi:hypothetical protein